MGSPALSPTGDALADFKRHLLGWQSRRLPALRRFGSAGALLYAASITILGLLYGEIPWWSLGALTVGWIAWFVLLRSRNGLATATRISAALTVYTFSQALAAGWFDLHVTWLHPRLLAIGCLALAGAAPAVPRDATTRAIAMCGAFTLGGLASTGHLELPLPAIWLAALSAWVATHDAALLRTTFRVELEAASDRQLVARTKDALTTFQRHSGGPLVSLRRAQAILHAERGTSEASKALDQGLEHLNDAISTVEMSLEQAGLGLPHRTIPFDPVGVFEDALLHASDPRIAWAIEPRVPRRAVGDPVSGRQVVAHLAELFTGDITLYLKVAQQSLERTVLRLELYAAEAMDPSEHAAGLGALSTLIDRLGGRLMMPLDSPTRSCWITMPVAGDPPRPTPEASFLIGRRVVVACASSHRARAMAEQIRFLGASCTTVGDAEALRREWVDVRPSRRPELVLMKDDPAWRAVAQQAQADPSTQGVPVLVMPSPKPIDELVRTLAGAVARIPAPSAPANGSPAAPRVLVVEDNAVNQRLVKTFLEKLGCQVGIASHGAEGLEQLRAQPWDLVLMDCNMPVMDGYEATRRIRALPDTQSTVPIIALSALPEAEAKAAALHAGMDQYLAKPVQLQDLRQMLQRWVPQQRREHAIPG